MTQTHSLTVCQEKAWAKLKSFLIDPDQQHFVLSGFAGTGKTFLLNHLASSLEEINNAQKIIYPDAVPYEAPLLTATTHKAASVLEEQTGTEVQTIHSLLSLKVKYSKEHQKELLTPLANMASLAAEYDRRIVIIDEASMIDKSLMSYITQGLINSKVIFVGDPTQLKPVMCDEMPAFVDPCNIAELSTVMRNPGPIENLAAQLRNTVETQEWEDWEINGTSIQLVDGPSFQQTIDSAFLSNDFIPDKTAKILAWRNDRVRDYNKYISDLLEYPENPQPGMTFITNRPVVHPKEPDKVLLKNNQTVILKSVCPSHQHGIRGYVLTITGTEKRVTNSIFMPEDWNEAQKHIKQAFKNKNYDVTYQMKNCWADLRRPFASTVHKSQGSTYDQVFVDLKDITRCPDRDALARMLYVAVSRASQQVVLYGQLPSYLGSIHVKPTFNTNTAPRKACAL